MASGKNVKKSIRHSNLAGKTAVKAKSKSKGRSTGKSLAKPVARAKSAKTIAIEAVKKPLQKSIEGLTKSSSYKMVDELLLRLSPNVQSQLDKISHMVETNTIAVSELKTIGFKVLQKAMEVSTSLKDTGAFASRRKTPTAKR